MAIKKSTAKKAVKEKKPVPHGLTAAGMKEHDAKTKKDGEKTVLAKKTYKTFNEAFFAFQGMDLKIPRNGEGRFNDRTYKYATLDDTLKIIIPALQSVGLMLTQPIYGEKLHTSLVHVPSGEKIESEIPTGSPDRTQDLGTRITYLRRYQVTSMLSLSLEEDTDARPRDIAGATSGGNAGVGEVARGPAPTAAMAAPTGAPAAEAVADTTPKTLRSEPFQKANAAIDSCMGLEALVLIRQNIGKSTRLTDEEKVELITVLEAKEHALNAVK